MTGSILQFCMAVTPGAAPTPLWIAAFGLLLLVAGIATAVRAIMTCKSSQGAIAWSMALLTLPVVAVPTYWILGRNKFNGRVGFRRRQDSKLSEIVEHARASSSPFHGDIDHRYANARVLKQLCHLPFFGCNDTELLIDGAAIFDAIIASINRAENYVLAEFYIVRNDELGTRFQTALIDAAKRGCDVFLLYDDIGSHELSNRYCGELRRAGVEVSGMNTTKGPGNRFQLNFRNHRKIVVIDGLETFIGGANVGDDYVGQDRRLTPWRDTHVRVTGPAALAAQLTFLEDWHWATSEVPDLSWDAKPADGGADKSVFILPSGPDDEYETCGLFFNHCINSAKERLWISSPYFVPDEGIVSSLRLAAMRGVDVRILIPGLADNWLVKQATMSYVMEVVNDGIQMFEYDEGFIHQKVALIDDVISVIGTANFDNRSFRLNFEISVVTVDSDAAKEVEKMLEADFSRSSKLDPQEVASRSFWFHFSTRMARLFSPIL